MAGRERSEELKALSYHVKYGPLILVVPSSWPVPHHLLNKHPQLSTVWQYFRGRRTTLNANMAPQDSFIEEEEDVWYVGPCAPPDRSLDISALEAS